jgi:NAD(P)-dependent dehydrogenase (short-subunit alcohol dehydrogenase family)
VNDRPPIRQAGEADLPVVREIVTAAYDRYLVRMDRPPAPMLRDYAPAVEAGTRESAAAFFESTNALPVPWVEPVDVSNAVLFLASGEARYITGVTLPVDAGALVM